MPELYHDYPWCYGICLANWYNGHIPLTKLPMNHCSYLKSDLTQCEAYPIQNSEYCFRHDPNSQEAALVASQQGGRNRRLQGQFGEQVTLNSPKDIKAFLGNVMNAVWTGEVPVQVGTSMGFLARCFLDAHEAAEVDEKIEEIQKQLEKQRL